MDHCRMTEELEMEHWRQSVEQWAEARGCPGDGTARCHELATGDPDR